MKKSFFLSILAVGALVAGCAKSEIVDTKFNEEISFETYLGRDAQTKGEVITNNNLDEVAVYAYYTGNTGWTNASVTNLWGGVLLIDNQGEFVTEGTEEKYWANPSDLYSFFAYAPVNDKVGDVATIDPKVNFVVQDEITNQVDLLYAEPYYDKKASDFVSGEVALTMKHALSRLTIKASASGENFKFDIKEITVTGNFRTEGILPLSTGIWNDATVNDQTSYLFHRNGTKADDGTITYTKYVKENALSAVDYASYTYYTPGETDAVAHTVTNNYLMVIPSSVVMNVNVVYSTYYMNQESAIINNEPIEVKLDLEKGKAYSINLEFSHAEKPITFSVDVEDWVSESNPENNTDKDINA